MRKAIILFSRIPVAGKTKTRLMPMLSPKACMALHRAMLLDLGREANKVRADLFVCYTGKEEVSEEAFLDFKGLFGNNTTFLPQRGEGLGMRMYHAFMDVFLRGYDACLLTGSDIPDLSDKQFKEAFSILKKKDLVFGPSLDGGYYLVGMKRPEAVVFDHKTYSHDKVLKEAIGSAKEAGLSYDLCDPLSDLDLYEDIVAFRKRRREVFSYFGRKSHTEALLTKLLKISIIIPVYNEEKTIEDLQRRLMPVKKTCEIIFVDGGSKDKTCDLIGDGFKLVHSPKGRGNQMNVGAKVSKGDVLFFLHADSILPEGFEKEIKEVITRYSAGCFGITFDSDSCLMKICSFMSNVRAGIFHVMFGDQGIFMDRESFFSVGGFPSLPLMEDYQFSLNLKKAGIKSGMTGKRIQTSARRFPDTVFGKLRIMWKMQMLRRKYRKGADMEDILSEYRDIR